MQGKIQKISGAPVFELLNVWFGHIGAASIDSLNLQPGDVISITYFDDQGPPVPESGPWVECDYAQAVGSISSGSKATGPN